MGGGGVGSHWGVIMVDGVVGVEMERWKMTYGRI